MPLIPWLTRHRPLIERAPGAPSIGCIAGRRSGRWRWEVDWYGRALAFVQLQPLQGHERDVILLLPARAGEIRQLAQQEHDRRRAVRVCAEQCHQAWEAEHLALRIVGLHQTVAVEQQAVSR